MLRSANEIIGYRLKASDGHIGKCRDFLFDDHRWTIRYMVADTGPWLLGKTVLISPIALGTPDWLTRRFEVRHTKSEIETAPALTTDAPVTRQYEQMAAEHYGHLLYWIGDRAWGLHRFPGQLYSAARAEAAGIESPESAESALRSVDEVSDYRVEAPDGTVGHVADFLIDDQEWRIRYLVVKAKGLFSGDKILLPPGWVESVKWRDREVRIGVTRASWEAAPPYDEFAPLSRAAEAELDSYFGPAP